MKEKITPTREQSKQVSAFIREVYDFNFKGGRVFLNGRCFERQYQTRNSRDTEKQAFHLIRDSGAAYASLNVYKPHGSHCRRTSDFLWRLGHIVIDIDFKGA